MKRIPRLLPALLLAAACGGEKDPVVAKVGKLKITQSEFQRKLGEVSAGYQDYVLSPHGRRQFLDVLVREKLVLAAAQQSDIPRSPEYRAQLEKLRREEEERVREGGEYLMTNMWVEELRRKGLVRVDEAEVRAYWEKHPVEVDMRHVLLGSPEKAEEVAKRLRGGANFAKVAQSESLDAAAAVALRRGHSRARGGRLPHARGGDRRAPQEQVRLSRHEEGLRAPRVPGRRASAPDAPAREAEARRAPAVHPGQVPRGGRR
jgi:hypothetical protein